MNHRAAYLLCAALVLAAAGCSHASSPARGALTVINRTTAEIVVTNAGRELRVPGCDEATAPDFKLNAWTLTSPGRDTFYGGNDSSGPESFILVTSFPTQSDSRPAELPPCEGLLQPAES